MRIAAQVELSPEQRTALERMARQRSQPRGASWSVRVSCCWAADGLENKQIAQRLQHDSGEGGAVAEAISGWRHAALQRDAPRPGKPRTITDDR